MAAASTHAISPASPPPLADLLHRVFGHQGFRDHQQAVCEAAASGRDVLLVMPTGAGKSLCYQLPTLARGGTGLVISPLIALMDDQAGKLATLGLRVARIHSGLPRETARQACRDYLEGQLDFLFIAPERLRVPGFPEMLARRKPALVAIDEAHCISQWGHDFRPDYRTLGQYLPALRPAPIMALTATATPAVQQDILRALDLRDPAVFITGFRRDNLHIEVTELSKPQRLDFIRQQLKPSIARPAIVYASSRRAAEEIASALGSHFPVAAYHAGLDPTVRERVQRGFLDNRLDVIVATIAFGMGVDKSNVRTVIHAALPGSVEAYYQEIGRAGRDGAPSRAILVHSFVDRKTQEFLLDRSYPALSELERVQAMLTDEPLPIDALIAQSKMDREVIERCIEKLNSQGAAIVDFNNTIRAATSTGWQQGYDLQIRHRRAQIDAMIAYAEGVGCRMHALVRHFGSQSDHGRPCLVCDNCRPEGSVSNPARAAVGQELDTLRAILTALREGARSAGKLHTEVAPKLARKDFDRLLDGLARAALLHAATDTFRADDGREISYRKLSLTAEGRTPDDATLATVWLRGAGTEAPTSRRSSPATAKGKPTQPANEDPLSTEAAGLYEILKSWRAQEARTRGLPAFTIFHDSVLRRIAAARPTRLPELGNLSGIGPEKLDRYGAAVLAHCRGEASDTPQAAPAQAQAVGRRTPAPRPTPPSKPRPDATRPTVHGAASAAPALPARRVAAPSPADAAPLIPEVPLTGQQVELEGRLREWRQQQASTSGLPTFFVLSETAIRRIVSQLPRTLDELRSIGEIGPDKLARYGPAMLELCAQC